MPDGPWPATGAVLAAIETAAGREADRIAGKPEPTMYAAARDRLGDGRCLAVEARLPHLNRNSAALRFFELGIGLQIDCQINGFGRADPHGMNRHSQSHSQ